jgi:hypothetical protein
VQVVAVACAGYLLAAGVVVVDTFTAVNPFTPLEAPPITLLLAGAGLLSLLVPAGLTLAVLHRAQPVAGLEHP